MSKTPFNEENEQFFNAAGLYRLDFVEMPNGDVYAFDMRATKKGEDMSPMNSIVVFKRADICPEAFELIVNSPMLYKVLLALHSMNKQALNAAQQMQAYLAQKKVEDPTVDFLVKSLANGIQMIKGAVNVPVVGRDETLRRQSQNQS